MVSEIPHFIGGKKVAGQSGRVGPVFNPATGEQTARVPLASAAELQKALDAAREAFPGWAMTTPLRRARVLSRFKDLVEDNTDKLAGLITGQHGKVLSDARGEITRGG